MLALVSVLATWDDICSRRQRYPRIPYRVRGISKLAAPFEAHLSQSALGLIVLEQEQRRQVHCHDLVGAADGCSV